MIANKYIHAYNAPTASDKLLELIGFSTKTGPFISFWNSFIALSTTVSNYATTHDNP